MTTGTISTGYDRPALSTFNVTRFTDFEVRGVSAFDKGTAYSPPEGLSPQESERSHYSEPLENALNEEFISSIEVALQDMHDEISEGFNIIESKLCSIDERVEEAQEKIDFLEQYRPRRPPPRANSIITQTDDKEFTSGMT